ncbi:MAG TPA: flagellar protein FliT [Rhodocyclaceae bacterium]
MAARIEKYEEIGELSAKMVEAARTQDWDRLVSLEQAVSVLRDALMSGTDDIADMTDAEKNVRASLIQRILDDDAEIRRHTEPWMEHVRKFLETANNRRRIDAAYGADRIGVGNPFA